MSNIFKFVIAILTVLVSSWCFHVMWGWFVVPMGVRAIGTLHSAGFGFMYASLFLSQKGKKEDEEDVDEFAIRAIHTILRNLIGLGLAYICHVAM
jgi:hypothetical protein